MSLSFEAQLQRFSGFDMLFWPERAGIRFVRVMASMGFVFGPEP